MILIILNQFSVIAFKKRLRRNGGTPFPLEKVLQEAEDNENVSKAREHGGFFSLYLEFTRKTCQRRVNWWMIFVVPRILRHAHVDNTREKTHYYG